LTQITSLARKTEEISSLVNVAATNVGALTMMAPLSPTPHVAPANLIFMKQNAEHLGYKLRQ